MSPIGRRLAIALALALALAPTGCSGPSADYVDEGTTYNASSAVELLEDADAGSLANEDADNAADLRHQNLVALRSQGDGAAEAVSLLTRTFPADTPAVPFYVERATYEQTPAFVIVEAMGRPGTTMSDKRLWVIDENGAVLFSGTR